MKRIYYFTNVNEFSVWYHKQNGNRFSYSRFIKRFTEHQLLELMEEENKNRKESKIKANNSVDPVKKDKQIKKFIQSGLEARLKQDNLLKENDPLAYQEKINSQWSEERRQKSADIMKAIPKESKSKNGHRLKEVLTTEDRTRMAANSNITKRSKKIEFIKGIYDSILTKDWFTAKEASEFCEQYNFSPDRNYRKLSGYLQDKEFFEKKVIKIAPSKQTYFKKKQNLFPNIEN